MSKMSELSQALDELVACGEGLIRTANALRDLFSAEPGQGTEPMEPRADPEPEPAPEPQPELPEEAPPEPVPQQEYTFSEVRKAFTAKSRAGYTAEVRALISKYGADKLSEVKESDYPALMADLETIA